VKMCFNRSDLRIVGIKMRKNPIGKDNILEVCDVTLAFGGTVAIDTFSFSVERGSICSLIGPNGAGKSSILNVVNGVYVPNAGSIKFNNQQYRRMQPLKVASMGIGRTFQHNALFGKMTVLDNVMTGLSRKALSTVPEIIFKLPRARNEANSFLRKARETISFLELNEFEAVAVENLPYGVQKRVGLARALVSEPNLLLLDEPMAGMNKEEKREMSDYITDINRKLSTTIVLIEHDISVVMELSDHVVVLDYGRKISDGDPNIVKDDPEVISAYLGVGL
jgi:branched-chain amino acid transport system ATP-binding protein